MIHISLFRCDITPPIGHPLCAGWYPAARGITDPLSAHGIIFYTDADLPVVLCALDWAELSNQDHRRWRQILAVAAETKPDYVAVQCMHPHNTPWPDREAQDILDAVGEPNVIMSGDWCERARDRVAEAVEAAIERFRPCTHVATGEARVDQVASNRRVMGADGKVKAVRWTRTYDPEVRAAPEGVIDPFLKTISFWNRDEKLAVMHYYAVHPTSYDGDGLVTPDFTGLAREQRTRDDNGTRHIYFTGCAGNVATGKYNDGNPVNRELFTQRIHAAMVASERDMSRQPLERCDWTVKPVCLPPLETLKEEDLFNVIKQPGTKLKVKSRAAIILSYLQRRDVPIPITSLRLNDDIFILNLPGETFIEYQLFAQDIRPDVFVAVASYGDLGTGYITLEQSFEEGGYEPKDSFVSGKSEAIMRRAIETVLCP